MLLRFCPEPYHPFDPQNIEKYVVYETQKLITDIPSLQKLISEQNMSFKSSFDTYLLSKGINASDLWDEIDDAIVTLTLDNELNILEETKTIGNPENFFELVRFDFVIDEDLGIHLVEINMSRK